MSHPILKSAALLTLLALPLGACQTAAGTGAATGAVAGAVVAGPVGAVVGGAAGAVAGAAISPEETTRARPYVVAQRRPSVRVREQVEVGARLPQRVALYPVPADAGLRRDYGYTVVNSRTVLVDPDTREVVYVYE